MINFQKTAKLFLSAAILIPPFLKPASGREKTAEYCLVSPSAVDVDRSSRTSGSISMLGGLIGGGSLDRDVTERRTTNISDDSFKTKREQYAIECKLATESAKTDDDRKKVAQALFRHWFPELSPKEELGNSDPDQTQPNSLRALTDGLLSRKDGSVILTTPDTISEGIPLEQSDSREISPESSSTATEKQIDLFLVPDSYLQNSNRNALDLANFAQSKLEFDLVILNNFDRSCSFDKNFDNFSIRNIPLDFFEKNNYLNQKYMTDKVSDKYTWTRFYAAVATVDKEGSILNKYFVEDLVDPNTRGIRITFERNLSEFYTYGKSFGCLIYLFRKK